MNKEENIERLEFAHGAMILTDNGRSTSLDFSILDSPYRLTRQVINEIIDNFREYHPIGAKAFFKLLEHIKTGQQAFRNYGILSEKIQLHRGYFCVEFNNLEIDSFLSRLLPILNCESSYILKEEDDKLG